MNPGDNDVSPENAAPRQRTHEEVYPEQYADPLCGLRVRVDGATTDAGKPIEGTVERVVESRFGRLAILAEYGGTEAWLAARCTPVDCYTLDGIEVDLAEFLVANPDLEREEIEAIHDLQPGHELLFGGGAAALFTLRRELPGWPGGSVAKPANVGRPDLNE